MPCRTPKELAKTRSLNKECHRPSVSQVLETDVLVDGCLFDDCYASKKGGGFHQEDGYVSILNSLFYNNTAGSGNEEFGERSRSGE